MKPKYRTLIWSVLILLIIGGTIVMSQSNQQVLTGSARGFAGDVFVTVTLVDGKIVDVKAEAPNDTPGIRERAIEGVTAAMVASGSPDVDVVSGATLTSKGIINAVKNAINPEETVAAAPAAEQAKAPEAMKAAKVYQGFGLSNLHRIGPGKDDTGTQVYSFNQVFANALFDEEGRILALYVDQLEVATPNYDGAGMPHFSGFPGQGGYNYDEDHDGKVDGKTPDTDEWFLNEIASWQTKRQRGDAYRMGAGAWYEQMNAFQEIFVGMTVDEVEAWFAKYTSDVNGRPLKPSSTNEADKAKFEALSDEEKSMLVDVTTRATMSLNDSHGNIVAAIKAAYENSMPVDITVE